MIKFSKDECPIQVIEYENHQALIDVSTMQIITRHEGGSYVRLNAFTCKSNVEAAYVAHHLDAVARTGKFSDVDYLKWLETWRGQ